ncbi:Protein of unknown function DUF1348 [Phaffia rhodozyma]|uniref:DUF1348-domain-containing protein n=1 Tax=Phaffia rhodozyma TaxID=264483 RepID=A0A0F7SMA7_PHARH|nr:Protein of unknown function DUF1348 [Phaffia rhodozyma]
MATPPFTLSSAHSKVKIAQALWNTQNANLVTAAYTTDSVWRNRSTFVTGHESIRQFLTSKWEREKGYKLRKELFSFSENKIAVQFWYEYSLDPALKTDWFRCYGLEHWVFAPDGKMARRQMCGNDISIEPQERWFKDDIDPDSVEISAEHWTLDKPVFQE